MNAGEDLAAAGDRPERYRLAARRELTESIVPFWSRTLDSERGGIFNCWNNAGTQCVSRDKFTWSQGRFVWLWSRLADLAGRGLMPGPAAPLLEQAERTVAFLLRHALLDDGRCAFLLAEDGRVKEAIPGHGPAPSIYADCFVVMGLAEYARVSGDRAVFDRAWQLFQHVEQRIVTGGFPTWPEPIPPGYESHAVAMIYLNLTLVLRAAGVGLRDPRWAQARERSLTATQRVMEGFMLPGGRIQELRPHDDEDATLLSRHLNPGHALEGLWMLLTVAAEERRADWLNRAQEAVRACLERGWDQEYGGILHYVDFAGGRPTGIAGDSVYERNVQATWDTKLWWVHSEAIYTTALCRRLGGDAAMAGWFERVWDYSFRTFPHPDPAVGEWIQIRDRRGAPLERVVALPVKDPYHIARNLIQILELYSENSPPLSA